jgi:hypothetical protein
VPARKSAGDADESGRGLNLVHELTNARWGWHHSPSGPGKCVWAEFPLPYAAASALHRSTTPRRMTWASQ